MATDVMREQIKARRDALAAQMGQAQQEYNQLEQMLAELQRNLDAMHGGIQELDALLIVEPELPPTAPEVLLARREEGI